MTTIVKHRRTGNKYILLSINGEVSDVNPSRFISELFNQDKSRVSCSATVCDAQGNIFLAYIDDLLVTTIDGVQPSEILPQNSYQAANYDVDQPPATELDDKEFEQEVDLESDNISIPSQVSVTDSLDAPNHDNADHDDDDWI